jgi:CHAT domain-containing protein/Tfp pilus assembly protein PilF
MKILTGWALIITLSCACATDAEQHVPTRDRDAAAATKDTVKPGVVVMTAAKGSESDKAGLQEGDILLGWSRGEHHGTIESPFDVLSLEAEERVLGRLVIAGLRGTEPHEWVMGEDVWRLRTRPNFPEPILALYRGSTEPIKAGKLKEAVEAWRGVAGPNPAAWLMSWLFLDAALALTTARDWEQSDEAFQQSVKAAAGARPEVAAFILRAWGFSYQSRSNWSRAEECYRQAIDRGRQARGDSLSVALNLSALGVVARYQSHHSLAEQLLHEALAIQERLAPGSLDVASTSTNLGLVANDRGDTARAEQYWERGLQVTRRLAYGGPTYVSNLINLGSVARQRGEMAKAAGYYREAVQFAEKLAEHKRALAFAYAGLGLVALHSGDIVQAEEYYNHTLAIEQELSPESLDMASTLVNLGEIAQETGDLKKAEERLIRSLSIREKLAPDTIFLATSLAAIASLERKNGSFEKAAQHLQRALGLQQKLAPGGAQNAEALAAMGQIDRDRGRPDEAEENFRKALAIWDRIAPGSKYQAETLGELANVSMLQGKLEAAADLYEKCLKALENQTTRLGGGNELRSGFRAIHAAYYRNYAGLLIAQGEPALAFDVLERARARTLLETLAVAHADIRKGVAPELLARERSLQADIDAASERRIRVLSGKHADEQTRDIEKHISDLLAQYQDVEGQIRTASPSYAQLTHPQPLKAAEVQHQLLDSGTLLLEYSLGEERSYVFAVTPDSLTVFAMPPRTEIENAARRVYDLLTARNRQAQVSGSAVSAEAEYVRALDRLSRMVLGPVAAQLKGRRLLIVADGALQYIPFAVLPEPASASSRSASATPLMINHEIVSLPSASVLAVLRQQEAGRQHAPRAVAVLADPVFEKQDPRVIGAGDSKTELLPPTPARDRDPQFDADRLSSDLLTRSANDLGLNRGGQIQLPRLFFSRQEAEAIRAVTPRRDMKSQMDFDATRAAAMSPDLSQYRIVHFATHGLLNNEHPELSGLIFSLVDKSGQPQNGFLRLEDIYNLSLPADLVVLSACETGLGKEIRGEGLIGLTRGFMYAGASRVVASLWKVSDLATARLMARFYSAMEKDGMPPAPALRAAQISLWKQKRWHSPYYWAAFQIQGEWK